VARSFVAGVTTSEALWVATLRRAEGAGHRRRHRRQQSQHRPELVWGTESPRPARQL